MKKEDFIALGISDELAEKAAAASAEELKGTVPRTRLNEVITERDQLRTAKEKAETDLEALKKSAGDNAGLQKQIQELQDAAKKADADHAAELQALRLANAIRMAITDAQDSDIVAGLIDQKKLILGDDGKVTGLDEQLTALREEKPFLFKPTAGGEDPAAGKGAAGFRVGVAREGSAGSGDGKQVSMRDAIAAKISAQKNE